MEAGQAEDLAAITRRALEAAEQGRWDRVAACYREREPRVGEAAGIPGYADALNAMDRAIAERIRVAQAALAQSLAEASGLERRLALTKRIAREGYAVPAERRRLDQQG